MRQRQAEVLAPAGSFESMKAAIAAGADAVYIGGSRFGARAYADNLDQEQMLKAIDYAHLHGVSIYMTVNTLMKEQELKELPEYLFPYYRQGLDAVIVQDIGAFSCIRQCFPDLPVHVSTQMTVTGVYGAKLLAGLGAKRIVTARELSLEEIRRIHKEVPVEIESFVHGALCYCYSGQCLLSSFIGGRSGNRGRCAQPCRLPYEVVGEENRTLQRGEESRRRAGREYNRSRGKKGGFQDPYLLSLKDLCTLDLIPDLLEAGIDSLKIEGRMKSPRYTAGVVRTYRKYVDLYLEKGQKGYQVDPSDQEMLLDLFDRGGFTEGYYRQQNGPDMIARKEKPSFRQGNQELFCELDRLYVEQDKKESICGRLIVKEGEETCLRLWYQGKEAEAKEVRGAMAQSARNHPVTEEMLMRQMKKTGNTPFELKELEIILEGQIFLPVQALNELRRNGLEELERSTLARYRRKESPPAFSGSCEGGFYGHLSLDKDGKKDESSYPDGVSNDWHKKEDEQKDKEKCVEKKPVNSRIGLRVQLSGLEGFSQILYMPEVEQILIEADEVEPKHWGETVEQCHNQKKKCMLAMPVIFRKQAEQYFNKWNSEFVMAGFDGVLVRALEEIEYLHDKKIDVPIYGDHNLYTWNHMARQMMIEAGCKSITVPLELNGREIKTLGCRGQEMIGYGFLPAMVSAQCVRKTVKGCTRKSGWLMMKDRMGKMLPVKSHCSYCYNIIYNPEPLSLLDQTEQILELEPEGVRLVFTRESPEEVRRITREWAQALFHKGKGNTPRLSSFTRGHFKRGVE